MESRTKVAGHPIHPMLIVIPLGGLTLAVIFDIVYLATDNVAFTGISFWNMVIGIVGGLVAAVPGFIDWLAIPSGTRAKRIGAVHGVGNVIVTGLFALSAYLRWNSMGYEPSTGALVLSFVGIALAVVTGWLGGELVDRLGVGVDDGAHLDSPSSLRPTPASTHQHAIPSETVSR